MISQLGAPRTFYCSQTVYAIRFPRHIIQLCKSEPSMYGYLILGSPARAARYEQLKTEEVQWMVILTEDAIIRNLFISE